MDFRIGREVLICQCQVAGIDDHRKVRAAIELVCLIDRIVEARDKVRAERRSQVRTRGEAQYADSIGIDMPLGRMLPHQAHRALRVLQGRR